MSKTLSATDRPAECLGADPVIESNVDLDKALHELAFLSALNLSVDSRCTEQVESIKQQYERKKAVPIASGTIVYIKERQALLNERAVEYCKANRSSLIDSKKKTKTLPHGTVSFKDQPSKVEYRSGLKEADSLSLLDKLMQSTLIEQVTCWLKSILIFGRAAKDARLLNEVIELKPRISVSKIKKAFEEKRLTTDHLKQLGLKYSKGKEQLTVKPAAYDPGD